MILGIKEDFTSNVNLDSQLKATPDSGMYLNSGVHPSITVENLLAFLPKLTFTLSAWDNSTAYGVFSKTHDKKDLVTYNSKTYESIKEGTNQTPDTATDYWLETNIESLRIKSFINRVKDRVYVDLGLNKRIVSNEYLYHDGSQTHTLPNDYAAWVFEPKGSDYVSFTFNQISLQKTGTTPVSVYIINQDELITTLSVTPDEGRVKFRDIDYTVSGKGKVMVAIDSTTVISDNASVDPLKFNGFVAYTANGTGTAPETATYTYSTIGNGLGINITASFDGAKYIDNNMSHFGEFIRSAFEYMVFQMFLANSNNVSNRKQRIQMDDEMLLGELKNMEMDSVVFRYYKQMKKAKKRLDDTYDTELSDPDDGLSITIGAI